MLVILILFHLRIRPSSKHTTKVKHSKAIVACLSGRMLLEPHPHGEYQCQCRGLWGDISTVPGWPPQYR